MRRVGVALIAVAWAGAITGVVAVPAAPAGAAPCAFASASATSVAVVVDFGDGSPASAVCVPADSSDNGAAVLAARARMLGTPAPRFDSSGFVCGIDGYPSDGCGEQSGSTYAYWSYWHGTPADSGASAWDYSNVGAGGSRVHSSIVEGWRFQPAGAGNPSDPPPSGSPDPASTCSPPSTSTSTDASVEQTTPEASSEPVTSSTSGSTPSTAPSPLGAASESSAESSAPVSSVGSATTTTTGASSQAAAGSVRVTSPAAHASSPWPAVATGGVIIALGASGVIVARRRRGPP